MTHVEIKPTRIKPAIIDLVVGSLQIGQVVVLPTDTIYGLSCLADRLRPINKIYHLKKRDPKKPVLILVASIEMAKKYVIISDKQEKLLKKIWAKKAAPTTVILKNRRILPRELTRGSDGLAVRLPKSVFLIKILGKVNCPLVSTSLNLSGQKNITDLHRLHYYFPKKNNRPDLVIDAGPSPQKRPSRLIDLRDENAPIIIRK
ncbi:MAG: L-threonylcarbamoyladenylate synthase [Candidatus Falkowbacteria bacterium]